MLQQETKEIKELEPNLKWAQTILAWVWTSVFILPLVSCWFSKELAHIRNWQIAATIVTLILLFKVNKTTPLDVLLNSSVSRRLICIPMGAAIALFTIQPIFNYLALEINGVDFSIFDWMLAQTERHHFMYSPIYDVTHIGVHQSWILFLLLPIHTLLQTPFFLLVLGGILLASAVLPLFRLCRLSSLQYLDSIFICLCFLTSPYIGALANQGFRIESFYPVCFFSFLYFWKTNNLKKTFLTALLFLFIKEDAALYLIAWCLTAISFGDKTRFSAGLAVFSGVIFFVNTHFVRSIFLENTTASAPEYLTFWSSYGTSTREIISGMLFSPIHVLSDIAKSGWWKLYTPFLLAPFFSRRAFFTSLPGIVLLGTAVGSKTMHSYGSYYPVLLFCLALYGVMEFAGCWQTRKNLMWIVRATILFEPLFFSGYLKVHAPDFKTISDLSNVENYIKKNYPLAEIRVQTAAFPHLSYDLRLKPLFKKEEVEATDVALLMPEKAPYPFSKEELKEIVETHAQKIVMGKVILLINKPHSHM